MVFPYQLGDPVHPGLSVECCSEGSRTECPFYGREPEPQCTGIKEFQRLLHSLERPGPQNPSTDQIWSRFERTILPGGIIARYETGIAGGFVNDEILPPLIGTMPEREIPTEQDLTYPKASLGERTLQKKPGRGWNSHHGTRNKQCLSDADGA